MSGLEFDVLIIGGGHAGAEAAWAAGHLGARTALVTFQRDAIGRMSCNPAIGGIGKGQMVRELDALGGLMGLVTDETGIQFRLLNRRKGPAVWAPRAQADRELYADAVRQHLESCPNLTILEAGVEELLAENISGRAHEKRIRGVTLHDGRTVTARTVVITSGTFLRALMHCGEQKTAGGRVGEAAANGLSNSLAALGLELGRLKTGTPPRIARGSIDFSALGLQPGDAEPAPFSFLTRRINQPQIPCWITYTNARAHELIRANLHRAPMYSGQIHARGPRYCPSIEDKVVRFADKEKHQIFLEPEGRASDRIYVNGISTSLPQDVQQEIVASIAGLENARVLQWGYAVEYDFVLPEQAHASLMTKRIHGLFLAGQIMGTSGYEEAAGQGLMAGINAARYAAKLEPVVLGRDEAYIGVMIDDLVTRGVTEPYRMFTSRAEHRLHLRYDNADSRLTPLGRQIGLASTNRWDRFTERQSQITELRSILDATRRDGRCLAELLKRPEVNLADLIPETPALALFRDLPDVQASVEVMLKYAGYIDRQDRAIAQFRQLEDRPIPPHLDYSVVAQLRREAVDRWNAVRPRNVGQAARASGICPTDVTLLLIHLGPTAPTADSGTPEGELNPAL